MKRKPDSLSKLIDDTSFTLQYIDQIVIPQVDSLEEGKLWRKVRDTGVPFWDALNTLQRRLKEKTKKKVKVELI